MSLTSELAAQPVAADEPIIKAVGLKKYFIPKSSFFASFRRKKLFVKAVDGVSLEISKGEIYGIAGESGCGKSTLGRTLIRLVDPTEGSIYFRGADITHISKLRMRKLRSQVQIVFQDPYESINPKMTIFDVVAEGVRINRQILSVKSEEQIEGIVRNAMTLVQLNPPEQFLARFPHELSGGQRQRVAVARALAVQPVLIIADEPVSMLDVSIRAEVLNVMTSLRDNFQISFLMVTHDLAIAKHASDKLAIMYLGKIVEQGESEEVVDKPFHPYTQALIAAIPVPDPDGRKVQVFVGGEVPSAMNVPSGCRFHPRCPFAKDICSREDPELKVVEGAHKVACHFYEEAYSTYLRRMKK
jgi:peptide/nickel transport system ATP-binding protein